MSGRILFARHLRVRLVYKDLPPDQLNALIGQAWTNLPNTLKKVYYNLGKQKIYYADTKGSREHSMKDAKVVIAPVKKKPNKDV